MLQISSSFSAPRHGRPLFLGTGLLHILNLSRLPPPHETLQALQELHAFQPPLTLDAEHVLFCTTLKICERVLNDGTWNTCSSLGSDAIKLSPSLIMLLPTPIEKMRTP